MFDGYTRVQHKLCLDHDSGDNDYQIKFAAATNEGRICGSIFWVFVDFWKGHNDGFLVCIMDCIHCLLCQLINLYTLYTFV